MTVVAWLGLGLGVANIVVWSAVVVMARRLWRQLKPQLEPLLAMFLPQPARSGNSAAGVVERVGEWTQPDA